MAEFDKRIAQRLQEALLAHLARYHGTKAIKPWMLSAVQPPSYTDATRPAATSVPAGTVI